MPLHVRCRPCLVHCHRMPTPWPQAVHLAPPPLLMSPAVVIPYGLETDSQCAQAGNIHNLLAENAPAVDRTRKYSRSPPQLSPFTPTTPPTCQHQVGQTTMFPIPRSSQADSVRSPTPHRPPALVSFRQRAPSRPAITRSHFLDPLPNYRQCVYQRPAACHRFFPTLLHRHCAHQRRHRTHRHAPASTYLPLSSFNAPLNARPAATLTANFCDRIMPHAAFDTPLHAIYSKLPHTPEASPRFHIDSNFFPIRFAYRTIQPSRSQCTPCFIRRNLLKTTISY